MEDTAILNRIQSLVEEEHQLRDRGESIEGTDAARLRSIEERLDQCWDLLRQRRARRHAGEDPSAAEPRTKQTVEQYLQ